MATSHNHNSTSGRYEEAVQTLRSLKSFGVTATVTGDPTTPGAMRLQKLLDAGQLASPERASSTTFEDFMLAMSRKRVLSNGQGTAPYREMNANRWAAPVFEFGSLLADTFLNDAAYEEAMLISAHGAGAIFPFDRLTLCFDYRHDDLEPAMRYLGPLTCIVHLSDIRLGMVDFETNTDAFIRIGDEWSHFSEKSADAFNGLALHLLRAYYASAEIVPLLPSETTRKLNAKRKLKQQRPIQPVRTIHLADIRKVYERLQPSEPQGGTRASPREHIRVISDRMIHPSPGKRQFRPYRRKAKTVLVNEGVGGGPIITRAVW